MNEILKQFIQDNLDLINKNTKESWEEIYTKLDNFTKGFVVINGFNIGRYWEIGPQRTLYVPASLLKAGDNEIVVFESDGIKGEAFVEFCDKPVLQ